MLPSTRVDINYTTCGADIYTFFQSLCHGAIAQPVEFQIILIRGLSTRVLPRRGGVGRVERTFRKRELSERRALAVAPAQLYRIQQVEPPIADLL
jgi:hypothetical protein